MPSGPSVHYLPHHPYTEISSSYTGLPYIRNEVAEMANEEHVALLKQGVDAWNEWRKRHPEVIPDLSGANLSGAELPEANLSMVNLTGADLSEATLSTANLLGAKLRRAELSVADLREADLRCAYLKGASLRKADLSGAKLWSTDLTAADLSGVCFRGTDLVDAILDEANLTAAKLWSTQIGGWSIKRVICEHAFWYRDAKEPTHYGPGEFERLHSEGTTIELHYEGGISRTQVNTLPLLIRELETAHEGSVLRLKALEDAPGGAKATIAIEDSGDQDPAELAQELQEEANSLRQKLALVEHELNTVYEKFLPMMLGQAKELMKEAMSGNKHVNNRQHWNPRRTR